MKLTFDGISSCWEEGIPLGNGRMGAVLCSEPETDVLYLNDDTLWSGYPHAETSPVTPEIVPRRARRRCMTITPPPRESSRKPHCRKRRADLRAIRNGPYSVLDLCRRP